MSRMQRLWERLPQETRDSYGEEYFRNCEFSGGGGEKGSLRGTARPWGSLTHFHCRVKGMEAQKG